MSPDEFTHDVLPVIVRAWEGGCLCAAPGFLKLMSFDFAKYSLGWATPMALYDVEAIGNEIIGKRFEKLSDWADAAGGYAKRQIRECPRCRTRCEVTFTQYNINFDCCRYDFGDQRRRAAKEGLYLVGFYGLGRRRRFSGFRQARTTLEFLEAIGAG